MLGLLHSYTVACTPWADFSTACLDRGYSHITQYGLKVFERFLLGDTLEECYEAVAEVANRWLDMLDTQVCLHLQ